VRFDCTHGVDHRRDLKAATTTQTQHIQFMNRRTFILKSSVIATSSALFITGCGNQSDTSVSILKNQYKKQNLVASNTSYGAPYVIPDFVNAWGIATRPAGAGGHFWITAGGTSWQFVGDVRESTDPKLRTLFQDDLKAVTIPGADSLTTNASVGKTTGTLFNGAPLESANFRVSTQTVDVNGQTVQMDGASRFIFVTDSGKVSAWTDRAKDGTTVRRDGPTVEVFDGTSDGMAFFGVAIDPRAWDRLWLADFGISPQIRTLNAQWQLVPTTGFINPFATGEVVNAANAALGRKAKPGDPVPFNVQVVGTRVFVAYCISQSQPAEGNTPADANAFYAAEEDALDAASEKTANYKPNKGKLVEYDLDGKFIRTIEDDMRLNAPWGITIAPQNFGKLSGAILVGNFGGAGLISAFDSTTGRFIDHLRDERDERIAIGGLWALTFGNGASLGDSNALYFAAGPKDEIDGVFGSLRTVDAT
jgi:uncharacterized protein (TIGR03118 family)